MDIVEYGKEEQQTEELWIQEARDTSGHTHIIRVVGRGPYQLPIGGLQFHNYEVQVDDNMNIPQGRIWRTRQEGFDAGRTYLESLELPAEQGARRRTLHDVVQAHLASCFVGRDGEKRDAQSILRLMAEWTPERADLQDFRPDLTVSVLEDGRICFADYSGHPHASAVLFEIVPCERPERDR